MGYTHKRNLATILYFHISLFLIWPRKNEIHIVIFVGKTGEKMSLKSGDLSGFTCIRLSIKRTSKRIGNRDNSSLDMRLL